MRHYLVKICSKQLIILCLSVAIVFGFTNPSQALELESQPYFIKQIEKDRVLAVSPNFRGELTQTSLLPSLTEISESYHIKATRAVQAEKLNGKLVPGLIVYVETKSSLDASYPSSIVATRP
ncbi:MAG: hypothetical protein AAGF83_12210 [Cyanobacteria bacterium P01_G01_bin.67]